jgi:hypothetical protein
MSASDYPPEFLAKLEQVTGKRARFVVDFILQHGSITTEDLAQAGYEHPPRAVKDVRDQGIPLITSYTTSSQGKRIARYRFGDPSEVRQGRIGGRKQFSKRFKARLYAEVEGKCAICNGTFEGRELQVDHRVPYEIAGDVDFSEESTDPYMLLCGSCNRAKSWSCEHCPNWQIRVETICLNCYWAFPLAYRHVATREVRRTDILWEPDELETYQAAESAAQASHTTVAQTIKRVLKALFGSVLRMLSAFLS